MSSFINPLKRSAAFINTTPGMRDMFSQNKTRRKYIVPMPEYHYLPIGTELYDENFNLMTKTTKVHRIKYVQDETILDHSRMHPVAVKFNNTRPPDDVVFDIHGDIILGDDDEFLNNSDDFFEYLELYNDYHQLSYDEKFPEYKYIEFEKPIKIRGYRSPKKNAFVKFNPLHRVEIDILTEYVNQLAARKIENMSLVQPTGHTVALPAGIISKFIGPNWRDSNSMARNYVNKEYPDDMRMNLRGGRKRTTKRSKRRTNKKRKQKK
jgi:hypothetical protein